MKFKSRYESRRRGGGRGGERNGAAIDRLRESMHFSNVRTTAMRYIKLETHCRKRSIYGSSMERGNSYAPGPVIRQPGISPILATSIMRCEPKNFTYAARILARPTFQSDFNSAISRKIPRFAYHRSRSFRFIKKCSWCYVKEYPFSGTHGKEIFSLY